MYVGIYSHSTLINLFKYIYVCLYCCNFNDIKVAVLVTFLAKLFMLLIFILPLVPEIAIAAIALF